MAKKKKILETTDTLNVEDLIEHYLQLRFSIWDGGQYYQVKKWSVYEWLPPDKGSNEEKTKKQTRFDTKRDAQEFIDMKRDKLRKALYDFFEIEVPEKINKSGEKCLDSELQYNQETPQVEGKDAY